MSDWKPGDVAMAVVTDGPTFRVVRYRGDPDDYWAAADGHWPADAFAAYIDYRPVAVIYPESAEDVMRLAGILSLELGASFSHSRLIAALREFAAPTPPRPDEPQGLGAVVEDAGGQRWVRIQATTYRAWAPFGFINSISKWRSWADLDVRTEPLSEGVTP